MKWIFRDPAALALGFCGAPRSPRGDESDVRVWLLKFLSRSSVVGRAVGSDTLLRVQEPTLTTRGRQTPS